MHFKRWTRLLISEHQNILDSINYTDNTLMGFMIDLSCEI